MPLIGMLGCGNIAGIIAARGGDYAEIEACHDIDTPRMQAFGERTGAKLCDDIEALLACDFHLLVEAASIQAVRDYLPLALARGKDVVVLSVGALLEREFQTYQLALECVHMSVLPLQRVAHRISVEWYAVVVCKTFVKFSMQIRHGDLYIPL